MVIQFDMAEDQLLENEIHVCFKIMKSYSSLVSIKFRYCLKLIVSCTKDYT